MPLTWNEIKQRSQDFAREWTGEANEHAEAKPFWEAFFDIFGISRRRLASYEFAVKKMDGAYGFIDLFWKGHLLVEHKSRGKSLDKAYHQGLEYFAGLKESELPRYVIVCDFERFGLYDLELDEQHFFTLAELPQKIHLFGFIAGYTVRKFKDEDPINIEAAERLGRVHDALEGTGYAGKPLERFMVRLAFCLFADDTGIFEKDHFHWCIENHTAEDGSDLGRYINDVFAVLDTPPEKRQSNIDEDLARFPYVNGSLFTETFRSPATNGRMRAALFDCLRFNWAQVSPDIFGSLFQSVMNPKERRNYGAHYTSEKNILKVVCGLFLDDLNKEFEKAKSNKNKLLAFHQKISELTFLDPACGSGNFLVVTYRELRKLEIKVLNHLFRLEGLSQGNRLENVSINLFAKVNVSQFYGIEIDEFAVRVAEVALWMTDHQMNEELSRQFGQYFVRIPITLSPTIVLGNALKIDWKTVIPPNQLNYILGNPPFIGKQFQTEAQKADLAPIFSAIHSGGLLDYVSAWYVLAADYVAGTQIKTAFVSTNSVSQGEQAGVLWRHLFGKGIKIHFAHRTFKWSNEARGNAQVHCVIIGFAAFNGTPKALFHYETPVSEPTRMETPFINSYLIAFDDVVIESRRQPLCNVPEIVFGNMPNDGGHLLLTDDEKNAFLTLEPNAQPWVKPFLSAREFINGEKRWCLWLENASPNEWRNLKEVYRRVEKVREYRNHSARPATQKLAKSAELFAEIRQPKAAFILIPRVSSELREYIPMGFFSEENIVGDTCLAVVDATLYHFGVLTSAFHMAWVRQVCGRLESRYRYSNNIVYNNYPWPKDLKKGQISKVEECAQGVLDARSQFPNATLADLYDPISMPKALLKAHQKLDRAVDLCYRKEPFPTELSRLQFLFELYRQYTEPLLKDLKPQKRNRKN